MLIRKQTLSAVLPATTSQDTRYYLDAVQVSKDTAIATNGHILIKAHDLAPSSDEDYPIVAGAEFTGEFDGPVLLPADTVKRLLSVMPKRQTLPILQHVRVGKNGSDQTALVCATDLQVPAIATVPQGEQTFPDHAKIWPNVNRPDVQIILGLPVLEILIKSAKAIGARSVTFRLADGKSAQRRRDRELGHYRNISGRQCRSLGRDHAHARVRLQVSGRRANPVGLLPFRGTQMTLQQLHNLGFDKSTRNIGRRHIRVRCSRCDALVINGTPTHELGCPHAVRECLGCSNLVPVRVRYCPDCQ